MDLPRTRDCIVLVSDLSMTVMVDDAMVAGGWVGGSGVTWAESSSDNFVVTYSDGTYGGFLLWGSDEPADQLIAYTGNQVKYSFGVCCFGTWVVSTVAYEKYTLQSRLALPLVPITYSVGQRLRFSLRGLWTPEDEWAISGDPRGSNEFLIASVIQPPSSWNNFQLMLQTAI